ncbi:hypothetical protein F8M41_002071 [Gigaspora margarita]|uniref:CCHC-type domain-containing protein n=1 Tax=Gigaspora margarita TaxID=4874 RepID=A0A8H3XDF6_GIGMA|nr:hypothetical protein F8M41_002071 [Gigaspora margarita]
MDLCFISSSVVTNLNLFDEILNSNSQLQTDESSSLTDSENESNLTDSEEGLYPLAKEQSFSDWNDVENKGKFDIVANENSIAQGKKKCAYICENCGKDDHYKSYCPSHNV